MLAREYLTQIQDLENKIQNLCSDICRYRTMATSVTMASNTERVQTSGTGDKLAENVIKIIEAENEAKQAIDEYLAIKKEILNTIKQLKPLEYEVVFKRYVECKNYYTITEEMNYSYRHILRIHATAMKNVQHILDTKTCHGMSHLKRDIM